MGLGARVTRTTSSTTFNCSKKKRKEKKEKNEERGHFGSFQARPMKIFLWKKKKRNEWKIWSQQSQRHSGNIVKQRACTDIVKSRSESRVSFLRPLVRDVHPLSSKCLSENFTIRSRWDNVFLCESRIEGRERLRLVTVRVLLPTITIIGARRLPIDRDRYRRERRASHSHSYYPVLKKTRCIGKIV